MKRTNSLFLRIAAFCLVLVLAAPIPVQAAAKETATPRASDYVTAYNTYVCRVGTRGEIQIWFELLATGNMDKLGALSIELYEVNSNGTLTYIKTFECDDYASMLRYNNDYIFSYVSYMGSTTKTYRVYTHFWAGKNGDGDHRFKWGNMV